jgi:predicted aldo/keto reductase-like oxidoreductase
MKRRSFLKVVGGGIGAGALTVAPPSQPLAAAEPQEGAMPRRPLGRTRMNISVVGFPGLALVHQDQEPCTAAVHDAFERGINFFDVAPSYGRGDAEIKLGNGLQGLDRSRYFLANKTRMRDKEGARKELELSLERAHTDHFDLYQLHALIQPDDVKQALGPDGAIEALVEAREQGKVRFLGFSAHTTKAAIEAMSGFRFDTVMFPINFVELFTLGFGRQVLELAAEQGAGVLAIKPMCRGAWPEGMERTRRWWYRPVEDDAEIDLALRFTLSQKGVVAGIPPAFLDLLDKAIDVGRAYRPTTDEEVEQLRKLAATCESIFHREEKQVARHEPCLHPHYPDSPHEACLGNWG